MLEGQHHNSAPVGSGRIKYADPKSLPSYPSAGLRRDDSAAAAASLGWASQKPATEAKRLQSSPSVSASASTAAMLAVDPKSSPAWTSPPTPNSTGTRAAQLAAGSIVNRPYRASSTQSNLGSSAATLAFKSQPSPRQSGHGTPTGSPSLAAAQGALQSSRPRSLSSPAMKQTSSAQAAPTASAVSAATLAHKPSMSPKKPAGDAGAVPTTMLPRSMFTSHPPIGPEAEDQKKADEMHSSAVAMARKIFIQQQKIIDSTKEAHGHGKGTETAQQRPPVNLQEAAYKLAQDRLSKLDNEYQKNRDYQEYYGSSTDPVGRISMRQKLRRRASSDSEVHDRSQSERIRKQMSLFSNRLSEVDGTKRQQDRNAVLAAARRNVKARLEGMDQNISAKSGRVHHSKLSEWELKAHAAAQAKHESRDTNKGKKDVGGGKFVAQTEIDAIASKRMQPVLDDINKKAEEERKRQEALRAEQEAKRVGAEKQKAQEREIKENHRKLKEQQKNIERERRQKEKEEERVRKEEEKARKREEKAARAEQKRLEKEEARRSRELESKQKGELRRESNASSSSSESGADNDERTPPENRSTASLSTGSGLGNEQAQNEEPTSPKAKVKTWIKTKLSRRKSSGASKEEKEKRKSFVGGISLKGRAGTESSTSLDSRSASMREVAMAGKEANPPRPKPEDSGFQDGQRSGSPAKKSSLSSLSSDDSFQEASESISPIMTPPAAIQDPFTTKSSSPTRDSRFREIME